MITTPGRLMLAQALPEKYRGLSRAIDAKELQVMITDMAKTLPPDEFVDTLQKLDDLGRYVATDYGRSTSLGLKDLRLDPLLAADKARFQAEIKKTANSDILSPEEKHAAIDATVKKATEHFKKHFLDGSIKGGNSMAEAVVSGARGGAKGEKMVQQMLLGNLGASDSEGNYIPGTGLQGFAEGQSPMEYWSGSYGTRKSNADVQLATAKVGYLARQLTNASHRVIITSPDCETTRGIAANGDDPDNVGTILAQDVGGLKAGHLIRDEDLPKLGTKSILVRSPLSCDASEGVCSKCAGLREHGGLGRPGEAVGINATRSFVEPLTQAAIGSKHAGKQIQKNRGLEGFAQVNQFVQMPKEFVGDAVITDLDGVVKKIDKAPQGGMFIFVDDKRYHVPEGVNLKVKAGDKLEAGDVLSDGMPNPAKIVQYKGLGEGRRYFLDQFKQMLRDNNAGTNRRNVELFTRGFLSKVMITDPDGVEGYMPGDVVDYDTLAANWTPREGSSLKTVTTANNLYLERPYLHYTVGTRVTPKVAKTFETHGIREVEVHPKPPPFESETVRAQDFLSEDKDWMVQLAGEKLKSTLTQAAQRGGTSEKKSTSYYPNLINIAEHTGD
jgi:DNA-directed RNA polymerase subunit beta'